MIALKQNVHLEQTTRGLVALSSSGDTLYVCNASAASILEGISKGHDQKTICETLMQKHSASSEQAQAAFQELCNDALAAALIERRS